MRLKIKRETLLRGVGRTLGVVDRRGTMPILSHFLLEAGGGPGVFISATDLEVSFRGFFPAEVEEPGSLALPAHYFYNLIKEMPGDDLELTGTEKSNLQILVGESRYHLHGLPSDQFPPIPEITDEKLVQVDSPKLREMIEKTIFSVSGDDLQYHLSGIFWERVGPQPPEPEVEEGAEGEEIEEAQEEAGAPGLMPPEPDPIAVEFEGLRLISTDGHRLTLIQRPLPESEEFAIDQGILIPRKGVAEISRVLAEEEKVALGLTRKSLALRVNDKYLFIRLLEKKFPDYRRIIPKSFVYRFSASRKELADTLRRISLLSTERFKGVVLKFGPDNLEVTFNNPEVGEGRELVPLTMEVGDPDGLPLEIGFNARYLLEPLNVMDGDIVLLELNDRERPCKILEKGDADYFAIVMPMSL